MSLNQAAEEGLGRVRTVLARFGKAQQMVGVGQHSRLSGVLSKMRASRDAEACHFLSANSRLIASWKTYREAQRIRNRQDGHLFNPLVFFPIGETKHSELLGFLLKPDASHGQGSLFLRSFLKMLDVPCPERGDWKVTVEIGRVDLMIKRASPPSVIIIENKSHGALDQGHQLYRYWYAQIYRWHPRLDYRDEETHRAFQIIYLPGSEGKVPEAHSLLRPDYLSATLPERIPFTPKLLSFRSTIAEWLLTVQDDIPQENERLRVYLEFYQELCQRL